MSKPRQESFYRITDEELAAKLNQWSKDHNDKIPTQKDIYNDRTMPSPTTYINHFGSWKNALKAAGLDRKEVKKKVLFDKIQELIDSGIKPTSNWMIENDHKWVLYTAIRLYGSWSSAMIEMGFEETLNEAETQYIIDRLNALHDELGHTPVKAEIIADESLPYFDTCTKRFGGVRKMYKAAGLKCPSEEGKLWKKECIAQANC